MPVSAGTQRLIRCDFRNANCAFAPLKEKAAEPGREALAAFDV